MNRLSSSVAVGHLPVLAALALLLAATGCAMGPKVVTPDPPPIPEGGPPVPQDNEVVLSEGQQLVADAPWGRIKIEAGPGLRRVYTWRGNRRGVVLEPRETRFAGSMGIHYEGKPPVWQAADGITKVDVEEGHHDFDNVDDAMIWLQIRRLRYTWNNQGLVVGWKPDDDTLKVELWQFTIDGEKPDSLPDARADSVAVGPTQVEPQKMTPKLLFADGHTEPYTTETATRYPNAHGAPEPVETTAEAGAEAATTAQTTAQKTPAAEQPASDDAGDAEKAKKAKEDADKNRPRAKISGRVVNVRSRATTDSKVLSQAKQGDSVEILKEDKDWRYVEFDDGRKGWVANFLLTHQG